MPDTPHQRLTDTLESAQHAFGSFIFQAIRRNVSPMDKWGAWLRLQSAAWAYLSAASIYLKEESEGLTHDNDGRTPAAGE